MKKILLSISALALTGLSTAAVASIAPPTQVPEPGTLGLLAAGVAGIIAVARLGRRK